MRPALVTALCLLPLLAACKRADMYTQDSTRTWDKTLFFKNQSSMRPPVVNTVARDAPYASAAEPAIITQALLDHGEQRYGIFCTPCHGRAGNGEGMIVQRGFPHPPSFVAGKLRTAKAQLFYEAITNGYGAMYSYKDRLSPEDRWAVISYIRALQLSQNSAPGSLPEADQRSLEAAK